MRVCINKATGKLIEAQSGDNAEYGALVSNAMIAGYAEGDVEEKVVSPVDYAALLEAAKPPETFSDRMTASDAILPRYAEDLADAIVASGGSLPAALATKVADKKLLRSNG